MNRKQAIRLNESQLRRIVSESVKRVIMEGKKVNNKSFWGNELANDDALEVSSERERARRRNTDVLAHRENHFTGKTVEVDDNGNTVPVTVLKALKRAFIDYLQNYHDIWNMEDFRELPEPEQKDLLKRFRDYQKNPEKYKEPAGSWVGDEWREGYFQY